MPLPWSSIPRRRMWLHAVSLLAGLAGLVAGFRFGNQISGPLFGAVVAVNAGVFCAFMAAAVLDRLARLFSRPVDRG